MVTILGATASGKTAIAAHLAKSIGGEIISADSRQVYRGMDIGTGKDLSDYIIDGTLVPYHLIDIANAGYQYNVFEYQRDFLNVFDKLQKTREVSGTMRRNRFIHRGHTERLQINSGSGE